MFKRIKALEDRVSGHGDSHLAARRDINSLAERLRYVESCAGKVAVKVRDEDGKLITRDNFGRTQFLKTEISIEEALGAICGHLGLDLSVERRDPERIRIEEEVILVDVDV